MNVIQGIKLALIPNGENNDWGFYNAVILVSNLRHIPGHMGLNVWHRGMHGRDLRHLTLDQLKLFNGYLGHDLLGL